MLKPVLYQRSRPSSVNGYVFVDKYMENAVKGWVKNQNFPCIVLTGKSGTGKTTLAYILCNECNIAPEDILYVKGSIDNGVDEVRDRILPFVDTVSHSSSGRVVIVDEFDRCSPAFQDSLRNIIEDCMENARFIFTANYPHKIIDAMYSRCTHFHIDTLDRDQFMLRVAEVITEEGITFDLETLEYYTEKNYPDMRGIFNDIELYTIDGKLIIANSDADKSMSPWMIESVELMMKGEYREARNLICKNIQYEEYSEFYRLMYENIDWWAKGDNEKRDKAILIIKDHLVADYNVGDREIVLSACLTKLSLI